MTRRERLAHNGAPSNTMSVVTAGGEVIWYCWRDNAWKRTAPPADKGAPVCGND